MDIFGTRTIFGVLLTIGAFQCCAARKGMISNVPYKVFENQSVVLQKWEEMEDKWKTLFSDLIDVLSRHFNETEMNNSVLSERCHASITELFQNAKQMKMWAIKILDANPYHRGGELFSNYLSLGNYEECLSAESLQDVFEESGSIRGEYCLVHVQPHLPPRKDVIYYNNVLRELENLHTKTEFGANLKSSGWDYMSNDKIYGVCVPDKCTSDDVRQLINTYNQELILEESKEFLVQPVYNSFYSDDVFFFVSGYLLSYLVLSKSLPVKGFVFEVIIPFVCRILRILPMVLLVIGLSLLMPFTGSGPFWNYANAEATKRCMERWWSVLYFGSNFEKLSESCIGQAWYVCVDVQISAIILILIYIYKRKPRVANIILILLITLCVVMSPIYTHFFLKQPTLIFYHVDLYELDKYVLKIHEPQHHLLPYLAGFALAKHVLFSKPLRLSKIQISVGWAISLTMVGFVAYYPWVWNIGKYPDTADNLIYSSLALPFWCICTCWLTFTCSTGHGGLLNKFLSLNVFNYLNNVLLMVYLINVPATAFFDWRNESLLQTDDISMIGDSIKIWMFTYIFAYIMYILYEVPLSNALKTFVSWLIRSKSPIAIKEESQLRRKEVQV